MSKVVCTSCGYMGEPKKITKGSIGIELFLWLCFIVPGILYSLWRLSSRYEGCPTCGQKTLIPINSPMAKKFIRENFSDSEQVIASTKENSHTFKAAHGVGKVLGRSVGRLLK